MSARTLRVSAVGFERGEAIFIRTTVELASGLEIGAWDYVDAPSSADLVLFNLDSDAGRTAQRQIAGEAGQPHHVLCAEAQSNSTGAQLSLHRPVAYPALIQLLRQMQVDLLKRAAPMAKAEAPKAEAPEFAPPKFDIPTLKTAKAEDPKVLASEPVPLPAKSKPVRGAATTVGAKGKSPPLDDAPTQRAAETSPASAKKAEEPAPSATKPDVAQAKPKTKGPKPGRQLTPQATTPPRGKAEGVSRTEVDGTIPASVPEQETLGNGIPVASIMKTKRRSSAPTRDTSVAPVDKAVARARQRLSKGRTRVADSVEVSAGHPGEDRDRPARRFFDATRFLGLVKQAIATGRPVEIVHREFPTVRVVPDRRSYSLPADVDLDPNMFRVSSSEFEVHDFERESGAETSQWSSFPLWQLLYVAALYGSEGRLFDGASTADRLRLTVEPDYELVPFVEEHKTVARFLLAESADMDTVIARTGVELPVVIDFCNACEEVLLLERGPAQVDGRGAPGGDLAADNPFAARLRKSLDSKPKKSFLDKVKSILLGTW